MGMRKIKRVMKKHALSLITVTALMSSMGGYTIPAYASIVHTNGTDLSIGSLANVALSVDGVDISNVSNNLMHMKYNLSFNLPAGASVGDEIGVTVKNLAGLLDGNIDTSIQNGKVVNTDIKYQGEVVARIKPTKSHSVNYYKDSTDGATSVSNKLLANIEAGTTLDNYIIEVLKDLPNNAKLDVFVERIVPATFVNKDTPITGKIFVNGNEVFTVDYTLKAAKVTNPLNINKVNVDMTGNTAKLITDYKDGVRNGNHIGDIDFSLKISPQGMDLRTGSYITIDLPKDSGLVFTKSSIGTDGYVNHYPLVSANSAVNDNGVYVLKYDNVKLDVVDISDTSLTLKVVDGVLKNNDTYEITSATTDGLGISLTSDATNLISDDGTTLGQVDVGSKVVDNKGATLATITNKLSVKLINGEFNRDNVLDYVNNKYRTYYASEDGTSLLDTVRSDTFAPVETISGYSLVKSSEYGTSKTYTYKKLPAIPRGSKLSEFVTTDGLTLREPIVSIDLADSKDIAGYHIARREETPLGVKWIYEKDAKTPVMTRFIEYGTHDILKEAVEGLDAVKPELINGYIHFLTEKLSNGDTVHYYKRQEHNHKREVQTRWVDTEGKAIKEPVTSDEISIAGYVAGYKFVKTEEIKDNQVKGKYDIVYHHVYEKIPEADLTITTKFITEDGTLLVDSITGKKVADKRDIVGYELVRTSSPSETEFNYIYKKINTTDTIKPVDDSGHVNDPKGQYIIEYIDDNYERLNSSIKMNKLPDKVKNISGYIFSDSKLSGNTMYYIYKPSAKFVARFVDKDGIDLIDAVTGDTKPSAKEITGYKFIYTTTFKSGSVNYVYEKVDGSNNSTGSNNSSTTNNVSNTSSVNKATSTVIPEILKNSTLYMIGKADTGYVSGDRDVRISNNGRDIFRGKINTDGFIISTDYIDDSLKTLFDGSKFKVTKSGNTYTVEIEKHTVGIIGHYVFTANDVINNTSGTTGITSSTSKAVVDSNAQSVNASNTVVNKFVDGKGRTLINDRRSANILNNVSIKDYSFVETYKDGDVFKSVYRKSNEKVTSYKDEFGTYLRHSDVSAGFKSSVKIDGYKLVETKNDGDVRTHIYVQTGTSKARDLLTFKMVDSKGNSILSDTYGAVITTPPILNGYKFVETISDGSTIKFVYALNSDIITRYKEVDGEDLIHPVISTSDAGAKKIVGFDAVDRISDSAGTITYTYKRIDGKNTTTDKSTWDSSVKTSESTKSSSKSKENGYEYTTKYVDDDGNKIAADEVSNTKYYDRKEISGYKYVKTETNESDGVKTYIYEKLSAEEAKKQAESQAQTTSANTNLTTQSPTQSNQGVTNTTNSTGNGGQNGGNTTISTVPDNKDVKSIKTGLGDIKTSPVMLWSYFLAGITALGLIGYNVIQYKRKKKDK